MLRVRDHLDLGIGHDQREASGGLVEIGLALARSSLRLPPHLDDADLGQQRILDEGVEHQEAGVLLHEDVIDVVGLLLGAGHVLRADRLELHDLVAAGEDVHQRGHQPFDRIGDTSVETAPERPSGAGMSRLMSPR